MRAAGAGGWCGGTWTWARGCGGLTRFTLSPVNSCPKLTTLDVSACGALAHVLVQSASLDTVLLSKCVKLGKALLHAKCLRHLDLDGCEQLQSLMVWSDDLKELDLRSCINLHTVGTTSPSPPAALHTCPPRV